MIEVSSAKERFGTASQNDDKEGLQPKWAPLSRVSVAVVVDREIMMERKYENYQEPNLCILRYDQLR